MKKFLLLFLASCVSYVPPDMMTARAPPVKMGALNPIVWAGDLAGSSLVTQNVAAIQGVVISGAAASGKSLTASGALAASWATPTVGPSGVTGGTAGQIFVTNSTPVSAWTSLISYETTHGRFMSGAGGSDFKTVIGPLVGFETSFAGMWNLPNATAPSSANVMMYSDGSNNVWNTPNIAGAHSFYFGGSTLFATFTGSAITLNPATPAIQSGSSSTSFTVGTNKNAATLILQAGALVTGITLSAPGASAGTANTLFTGSEQYTTRTITGNLTVDTTTTDYAIIADTSSGVISVTLPVPTNGRVLLLIDKKNTFGTNNLTLVRNAAEKINGSASSKIFSSSGARTTITSDGTDWYTF